MATPYQRTASCPRTTPCGWSSTGFLCRFGIVTLLLAGPVYPNECPYQSVHCGDVQPTCTDRLPNDTPGSGEADRRFACRCDKRCVLYGDCCSDYWDHCVDANDPPATTSKYPAFFECTAPFSAELNRLSNWYVTVGKCPAEWPQDDIRQNCESRTLSETGTLLTLPANGPDNIVFKNVYCGLCHGIPARQLELWSVILWQCRQVSPGSAPDFNSCSELYVKPPATMTSDPHVCYPNFVDSCLPTATPDQIASCENHTSIVFTESKTDDIAFKNIHCANCREDLWELQLCVDFTDIVLDVSHSFTLLFDFANASVRTVEKWDSSKSAPRPLGSCSRWQIFDPFLNACRQISCPPGTTLRSSDCVETVDNHHGVANTNVNVNRNRTNECFQMFTSLDSIAGYMNNLSAAKQLLECSMPSRVDDIIYVRADFSIAGRIQYILDRFLLDGNLVRSASHSCSWTTFVMVAASLDGANASLSPGCEGIELHDIQLSDIVDSVLLINNTWYYNGLAVMHVVLYEATSYPASNSSSRREYVKICSPFTGNNTCPMLRYDPREFLVIDPGQDALFVHKASGQVIPADSVWELPDGFLWSCDFLDGTRPVKYLAWLTILADISFAGGVCSLASLIVMLITYFLFPPLRNQPGKMVMNLTVALILAQTLLMVGKMSIPWLCVLRATTLHFAWLTVFFWMTLLAGDLAYSLWLNRHPTDQRKGCKRYKVVKLGIIAWGCPAVFVSVCYLLSRVSEGQTWTWLEYGGNSCWIVDPLHAVFAFGIPVALHLLVNCTFVGYMISRVIANQRRLVAARMKRSVRKELLLCLKLIVITGMAWTLFLAANLLDLVPLWYFSVIVNSLQGTLIGLMFLVKRNVRTLWRKKLGTWCRRAPLDDGNRSPTSNGPVPLTRISMGGIRSFFGASSVSSPTGDGEEKDGDDKRVESPYRAGHDVVL